MKHKHLDKGCFFCERAANNFRRANSAQFDEGKLDKKENLFRHSKLMKIFPEKVSKFVNLQIHGDNFN